MTRYSAAAVFAATAMLTATSAFAQAPADNATSIVVDHFSPQPFKRGNVVNVLTSEVHDHLQLDMGVVTSFVNTPLRLVPMGGATAGRSPVIERQTRLDIAASLGFFDVAELTVAMPFVVEQSGRDMGALGYEGSQVSGAAAGDLRLVPKARLWRAHGFGVALAVPLYLPTGDKASFNSDGALRGGPTVIVDWQLGRRLLVSANAGYELRKQQSILNYRSDDVVVWGVGAEVATGLSTLSVIANVFGSIPTIRELDATDFTRTASGSVGPIEGLLGARATFLGSLGATLAGSVGLNNNIGAPDYRVIAALSYTLPGQSHNDIQPATDIRVTDAPPPAQEPIAEVAPVIEPTPVAAEPVVEEVAEVPAEPTPLEFPASPEPQREVAVLRDDVIAIRESVRFKPGSDVLLRPSWAVLDGVVAVLKAHPEVRGVRIEGHTDNRGAPMVNMMLSTKRAASVKRYLVRHGISADRLDIKGCGESRPLVANNSPANRETNRRVEFHIEAHASAKNDTSAR